MKDRLKKWAQVVEDYELQQEDRQIELRMYKVRWIWYHTMLGIELAAVFLVLLAIYLKLYGVDTEKGICYNYLS